MARKEWHELMLEKLYAQQEMDAVVRVKRDELVHWFGYCLDSLQDIIKGNNNVVSHEEWARLIAKGESVLNWARGEGIL